MTKKKQKAEEEEVMQGVENKAPNSAGEEKAADSETLGNEAPENEENLEGEKMTDKKEGDSDVDADKNTETDKECPEEKVKDLQNKYLRLTADFDNYRKRTLKEKSDLLKSASEGVLVDLLPVIDDFERGMQTVEQAQDIEALKEGMKLVYGKFAEFLKQSGVKEIEAKEQDFDLDVHEAVTKIPAPAEELKGKVVDVIQKGYKLNDKVIRFAKVVIGE